jgi:plasmid maintenance system antidote protein VapI
MMAGKPEMTAEELRTLLESNDKSQQWLADALLVDKQTVNRWVNGHHAITKRNAVAIRAALKPKKS